MSAEENKAIAGRYTEEVWNRGNLAVIDELVAPTCVFHDPSITVQGPEGIRQHYVSMYLTAFPDTHVTIEDLIAEGDMVVVRWTARGTHQGELQGLPPTGTQITVTGITINRIEGGQFVEGWSNFDALGMLQQLGHRRQVKNVTERRRS